MPKPRPATPRMLPGWITENYPAEIVESTLFKFHVTMPGGNRFQVDVSKDLDIDYEQLEAQLGSCPEQYMAWAAVYSELKYACTLVERKIKVRRSVLTSETVAINSDNKFKLTVAQTQAVIEADEVLNQLEENLAKLQKQSGKAYHMMQAIQMRSENLRSLAGFKKIELSDTR